MKFKEDIMEKGIRISNLIKRLEDFKESYGDLEIKTENGAPIEAINDYIYMDNEDEYLIIE